MTYSKFVSGKTKRLCSFPRIFPALVISIALLAHATGVFANDSTAALGAGGIELTKSEHIRILEEVLEISPNNIRVKYRFLNESDHDICTKVAFPLPLYDGIANANVSIGNPDNIFASFKISVDNKPVATQRERKALLEGKDVTDKLRKLGLSDQEIFFDVSEDKKADLWEKLKQFLPTIGQWWDISSIISWDMTFPSGKELVVEHEYVPATGAGYAPWTDRQNFFGEKPVDRFKYLEKITDLLSGKDDNEDCLDERTKHAIENRVKLAVLNGAGLVSVNYSKVEYILGSGRNWKGSIGEFKLRLIKEKPEQFVSVCFPGEPVKTSPTTYEFDQKNFVPQDKLVVFFYSVDSDFRKSKDFQ